MTLADTQRPQWDRIDTVLLDLDGTLMDLAFDNYFWLECIPAAYAAARGLAPDEARAELLPRFRKWEGQLAWYCIDHWSRELGLDVAQMHHAERERMGWLPGAEEFLERLRERGKRRVLVTNAHPETLRIKDGQTGVTRYFDAVFSSHTFRAPKESAVFWHGLREVEPFDPGRTMFVDDSLSVLRAARAANIRWIYAIRRQSGAELEFSTVGSVAEL
jgi:putative hydrolase of the HAD superfamily